MCRSGARPGLPFARAVPDRQLVVASGEHGHATFGLPLLAGSSSAGLARKCVIPAIILTAHDRYSETIIHAEVYCERFVSYLEIVDNWH
jgi:hypothetical protein